MVSEMKRQMLAIDLGASSGRVMLGTYDQGNLQMKELHRFANGPIEEDGHLRWDVPRLLAEIKCGLAKAVGSGPIDSLSVDTWGVDFGLLDEQGELLENPVHYRDNRTEGMCKAVDQWIPEKKLYEITGIQRMEINTLFQLQALRMKNPEVLAKAKTLLFMPDLISYLLCGEMCCEYSIASTSQMLDAKKRTWSEEILEGAGIRKDLFPKLVMPGTRIGTLKPELQEELGLGSVAVIAGAGHDTQSAMAAVPAMEEDFLFLSCGTWALFGTELDKPCMSEMAAERQVTNEGGAGGMISFLKNIIGTWLIQESRNQWKREGREFSFGQLEEMASQADAFTCLLDPDAPEFAVPGDMPARIRDYVRRTGQQIPETEGAVVRCINESLALKFRRAMEDIVACTGKKYQALYIVGGGCQSSLLCQMTANACDCVVCAGPVEATVMGNLGIQLMALGEMKDLKQLRAVVRASETCKRYVPDNAEAWRRIYQLAYMPDGMRSGT